MHCDDDSWHEEDDRYADPHQGCGELLIFEERNIEKPGRGEVRDIHDSIAEGEKTRERVTGQSGGEKIQGHRPSRPTCGTRPRLDYRPPEKKSGGQKAGVLQIVQPVITQRSFKRCRNVPSDQRKRGREPTDRRICDQMAEPSKRGPSEKWSYDPSRDQLRKSLKQRQRRSPKENEVRGDGHEQEMLHHVNGKGDFVERVDRGADCDPNRNDSSQKCSEPPERKLARKNSVQTKPTAYINNDGEAQSQVDTEWRRP